MKSLRELTKEFEERTDIDVENNLTLQDYLLTDEDWHLNRLISKYGCQPKNRMLQQLDIILNPIPGKEKHNVIKD